LLYNGFGVEAAVMIQQRSPVPLLETLSPRGQQFDGRRSPDVP
jgi:hypothetical protein